MVMIRIRAKNQDRSQSVQKLEWKQTDGRTDTTDRIKFAADAVGNDDSDGLVICRFTLHCCLRVCDSRLTGDCCLSTHSAAAAAAAAAGHQLTSLCTANKPWLN